MPDVKFPKQDDITEFERALLINKYDEIARVAKSCKEEECYRELSRVVDMDAYLRWLSFNSLIKMGDYVDEVWFYASDETRDEFGIFFQLQAWDLDDAFQECHNKKAFIEMSNSLLY